MYEETIENFARLARKKADTIQESPLAFCVGALMAGGGGNLLAEGAPLLNKVAAYRMNSPAIELLARAILCNWLVCLSLWMAARTNSDSTKCIVIFWCLFAFIASGYEHSVANMTLLSLALLGNPTESITIAGMVHNLLWVTLGNTIGGGLFMAAGYWIASPGISLDTAQVDTTRIQAG